MIQRANSTDTHSSNPSFHPPIHLSIHTFNKVWRWSSGAVTLGSGFQNIVLQHSRCDVDWKGIELPHSKKGTSLIPTCGICTFYSLCLQWFSHPRKHKWWQQIHLLWEVNSIDWSFTKWTTFRGLAYLCLSIVMTQPNSLKLRFTSVVTYTKQTTHFTLGI